MNPTQRDRMQRAAEDYADSLVNDDSENWDDRKKHFLEGYTRAAKDAQAALDIARKALEYIIEHEKYGCEHEEYISERGLPYCKKCHARIWKGEA